MTNATKSITCKLADTPEMMDQVFQLRHACYLRTGAIEARPDGRFRDSYDDLPNHFSFLLYAGDAEPVATVRISVVRPDWGWTTAPVNKVFGDHPNFQPIASGSFVEASRLCFAPQARRGVLMRLVANMAALADFYEVDWMVACPREEHAHSYRRMFGFESLGEPRQYFGVNFRTELLGVARGALHSYTKDSRCMREACDAAAVDVQPEPAREVLV